MQVFINSLRFANGNAIIWDSLIGKEGTACKINAISRQWGYNNERVLEQVKKNGWCWVEVAVPNTISTGGKHWILFIGNQKMFDPYTCTIEGTSKYGTPTGFCVVNATIKKSPANLPVSLPGTVSGGGVTLTKLSEQDAKTGVYRII
jgi:hypothetical protein